MTVVDLGTGEVNPAERSSFVVRRGEALRSFEPTNPAEMERFIREAVGLLEELPDVLLEINTRRYAAERAHSRKKNTRMADFGRAGVQVSFARAQAEADALPELETWHSTRAEYHYAEDTSRALRVKVMAMLNINKAIATQFAGAPR